MSKIKLRDIFGYYCRLYWFEAWALQTARVTLLTGPNPLDMLVVVLIRIGMYL